MDFILSTALLIVSIIFNVISIILGVKILLRFSGHLKTSMIFLNLILIVLFARNILRAFSLVSIDYMEPVNMLLNFIITLLLLLVVFYLNKIINKIDNKYAEKNK